MSFIIDPTSLSYEAIRQELVNYVQSLPDYARWTDFFTSTTGQTIIDLIAAQSAFLSYNNIVGRRESFLRYAKNRSSVIAGAETLGYSSYRGRNIRLKLRALPMTTGILRAWDILGTVKDRYLILEKDTVVNAGTEVDIDVIVGSIKEQNLIANSTSPQQFRFTFPNVSQDVKVFLEGSEVVTSEKIIDLTKGNFVVQSNVYGSVDVVYLNLSSFSIRYNYGNTISLKWIELFDLVFKTSDVKLQFNYGTLLSYSVNSSYDLPEDIDSIRINSTLFNETQFVIRGREDYVKIFQQLVPDIVSILGIDASPAIVKVFYVKNDLSLLSSSEKSAILHQLVPYRPFGVMPPDIADAMPVFSKLKIAVKTNGNAGNPTVDINAIIDSYEKILYQELLFEDIENAIEALSYVKIARVTNEYPSWTANTPIQIGNGFVVGAWTWYANRLVYLSGNTEPDWPLDIGSTIEDGSVVWMCREKLDSTTQIWEATKDYRRPISALDPSNPLANLGVRGDVVLPSHAIGMPATKAFVEYGSVTFRAVNTGSLGNLIALIFNNTNTIEEIINEWNISHPSNMVTAIGNSPSMILPSGVAQLAGGTNFTEYNREYEVVGLINLSNGDIAGTAASSTYFGITFTAVTIGAGGNSIQLVFTGTNTVAQAKNAWNTANAGNQVTSPSASDNLVLPSSTTTLSGGSNFLSGEPEWSVPGFC